MKKLVHGQNDTGKFDPKGDTKVDFELFYNLRENTKMTGLTITTSTTSYSHLITFHS